MSEQMMVQLPLTFDPAPGEIFMLVYRGRHIVQRCEQHPWGIFHRHALNWWRIEHAVRAYYGVVGDGYYPLLPSLARRAEWPG